MNRMGETRDMFWNLGYDDEIVNLGEPHVPFNPSSERERDERFAINQFRDDYVITPFLQSIQVWRMRAEEDRR
jgi:hypothetical protein